MHAVGALTFSGCAAASTRTLRTLRPAFTATAPLALGRAWALPLLRRCIIAIVVCGWNLAARVFGFALRSRKCASPGAGETFESSSAGQVTHEKAPGCSGRFLKVVPAVLLLMLRFDSCVAHSMRGRLWPARSVCSPPQASRNAVQWRSRRRTTSSVRSGHARRQAQADGIGGEVCGMGRDPGGWRGGPTTPRHTHRAGGAGAAHPGHAAAGAHDGGGGPAGPGPPQDRHLFPKGTTVQRLALRGL